MDDAGYWSKYWRERRMGRRRFLGSAALGTAGLAAASLVGCSEDTSGPRGTGDPDEDSDELFPGHPPSDPHDARQVFDPAPSDQRGGTFTYIGFDAVVLDRYDPHQTQFGPMYSNQSAVFSKLYCYKSHIDPTWENIFPDLAESAPEMIEPDAPLTYIVKLRKGVKFHDTDKIRGNFPDLAGRELTAEDVAYSYNRQRDKDSYQRTYYYRSSQYGTIENLEIVDDYTLRITTKEPTAPFYHFMADTNAMIIPKEIVDMGDGPDPGVPWDSVDSYRNRPPAAADRMIGTGPFIWDSLAFGIEFNAVRNPAWFGWDEPDLGRPYLSGYRSTGQGLNDATVESLFRRKEIDVGVFIDNPAWIQGVLDEIPDLVLQVVQISGWLNSRLKAYCEPFNDWRVRRALHLAVDRQEASDIIGSGTYKSVGPVGGAIQRWAMPDDELLQLPGYRRGAGREEDIAEARRLYEAAGKPDIPLMWFADVPAYIPRYAPTYIETIKRNLGMDGDIKFQTVPYSRIAEGLVSPECDQGVFTWGFDNGWIDLDDWVYPYFKTGGPKNSFQVSDPVLDDMLDKQRREFDFELRKATGLDIQRYLLGETNPESPAANARLDYIAPVVAFVYWPYVRNPVVFPWFGSQYWASNIWLDKSHPSYEGRGN